MHAQGLQQVFHAFEAAVEVARRNSRVGAGLSAIHIRTSAFPP
ncbi:hypothetical protein MFUM_220022 [Methylacidiphilum fumariolicum SolV]|uniref:Uncharacterized protein n=2 Tax=Candidatus Methylacidiphilum fumarolicum TaxID=591154 RepID=I0JX52_METFB|nr:conserved protein of unknown function [Candidatus Methylacidiphilum fumarolicum]CCG91821.1 hypothetical protein MFUM_220022 [Methylacidiphilum fumariolicum SolV]